MKRLLLLTLLLLSVATPAAAQQVTRVTVTNLLENGDEIRGDVVVVGELIGDYGFRSDGYMWTQLNQDTYAYRPVLDGGDLSGGNIGVAIRIPTEVAETLDGPGGYRVRGPLVRVTGEWKWHDPERGGESYVDVVAVDVLQDGYEISEHPNYWVLGLGLILIVAAGFLRRGRLWTAG